MKKFNSIENSIRKSFFIYIFLRKLAPFICKFIDLEEGFSFSKQIRPLSLDFCILDVGSNDGTSIRMFRRYFPLVKIFAFDPITTPRFKVKNSEYNDWEQQYLPAYNRGMLLVTTNQGVMSHHDAVNKGLGGFLIGYVY